jgi:nicotinic acid mononucleotide adenylyltransferase
VVEGSPFAISSTSVRRRVAAGLPVRHLVSPAVEAYITEKELYRKPDA